MYFLILCNYTAYGSNNIFFFQQSVPTYIHDHRMYLENYINDVILTWLYIHEYKKLCLQQFILSYFIHDHQSLIDWLINCNSPVLQHLQVFLSVLYQHPYRSNITSRRIETDWQVRCWCLTDQNCGNLWNFWTYFHFWMHSCTNSKTSKKYWYAEVINYCNLTCKISRKKVSNKTV